MNVKQLIENLRQPYEVEIREDNYFLCKTRTNNKTMELFYNRVIIDWFPVARGLGCDVGLVINIKSEDGDD